MVTFQDGFCHFGCTSREYSKSTLFHPLYKWLVFFSVFITLMTPSAVCESSHFQTVCYCKQSRFSLHWGLKSRLSFNVTKCCLLHFHNRTYSLISVTYHVDYVLLSLADTCKDLGGIFFSDLSGSQHYSAISARAYHQLGLICQVFSTSAPIKVKKTLYLALVWSQFTYCSQVWRLHFIKDITSLERSQQWATKFILNDFTTYYRSRLISLNLFHLMYFFKFLDILFFLPSVWNSLAWAFLFIILCYSPLLLQE